MAIGWPTLATVAEALRAGDDATAGAGGEGRPFRLALETARLVLATEAIALPSGLPLALLLFRTDLWGRRAVLGLMAVSAFVPMPLLATAWLGALGNAGRASAFGTGPILSGWAGAAFVHAMASVPWVVLLAGVGLRAVEPELEEAALLDMPAWRVLVRVTLRRSVGALAAAALAVAVLTAGDMTVTDLLQVRTYRRGGLSALQPGRRLGRGGRRLAVAGGLRRPDPARRARTAPDRPGEARLEGRPGADLEARALAGPARPGGRGDGGGPGRPADLQPGRVGGSGRRVGGPGRAAAVVGRGPARDAPARRAPRRSAPCW